MIEAFMTNAPTIGLVFFFMLFVCIALWAYRPRNKGILQKLGEIPLKDDEYGR